MQVNPIRLQKKTGNKENWKLFLAGGSLQPTCSDNETVRGFGIHWYRSDT